MDYCDHCLEFSRSSERCTWCGQRMKERTAPPGGDVACIEPASTVPDRPPFTPFAEAIAPVRSARQTEVRAVAAWALEHGLPCDRDTVALCLEVLERFVTDDGGHVLRRVDVNHVLTCDAHNWSTFNHAMLPGDLAPALWIVLHHLRESGALLDTSDPFSTLLEPLQCYGGLGEDGRRRPEGIDVDFPCQCFHAHDPTCPDGLSCYSVGFDRETYREFVVHAELALRCADPPVSTFEPLFRLTRRVRAAGGAFIPFVEEFSFVGRIPETKLRPELWMYRLDPVSRRGFAPLVVDAWGRPFVPKADRRRKLGYRWRSCEDFGAMYGCGVAARQMAVDKRERRWEEDELGVDGAGSGLRAI